MGAVFEVVHANTGEHLALKVMLARSLLAPDLVERFRREARAATSVKSENVVRVTDADVADELDGAPFLVMELLVGQDFERLCASERQSPGKVLEWLRPVARALDKAHRQGVVHRDLKPENLFLAEREDDEPIVKILDFGIAKMTEEGGQQTASDQILGTPRYMAPEQTSAGPKEMAPAIDRFALGLIAFRMLAGRHYFDQENVMKLLLEVSRGPTAPPSALGCDLGPAFDEWFARACAREPRDRFDACAEEIESLAAALGLPTVELARGDSSRRGRVASVPERESKSEIAKAPTLQASVITASQRQRWLPRWGFWAIGGVVLVLALATVFGQKRAEVEASATSGAISATKAPDAVSAAPSEPSPVSATASTVASSALPGSPSSAATAPPSATVVPASGVKSRVRAPAVPSASSEKRARDSVWGER
jgi:serine/threonine-protein kinase